MAADGVHSSVKAIQDMEAAVARFSRAVVEELPEVERELRQISEQLEDRRTDLRREIAELEDSVSSSDDGDEDEDGAARQRQRLEEAEQELASIERRIRRLEETRASYTKQARVVENLATAHTVKAKLFLAEAAEDLKGYLAHTGSQPEAATKTQSHTTLHRDVQNIIPPQPTNCTSIKEQKAWADAYLHPDNLPLSDEEREALAGYQANDFKIINQSLRFDCAFDPELKKHIAAVDSAIEKSFVPVELVAFNGARYSIGEQARTGAILIEQAFLSTSLSRVVAEKGFNKGTMIEITVPKGSKGLYMDELHKPHGNEVELLLPRKTRLRVKSKTYTDGIYWIKANVET